MPKIKSAFVIFGLAVSATANETHPIVTASVVHDKIEAHPQRMTGNLPSSIDRPWDRGQTRYVF